MTSRSAGAHQALNMGCGDTHVTPICDMGLGGIAGPAWGQGLACRLCRGTALASLPDHCLLAVSIHARFTQGPGVAASASSRLAGAPLLF